MKKYALLFLLFSMVFVNAQNNFSYWQQHVDYAMDVDMDVNTYQYTGTQKLVYTNNSPDVLDRVFYHMYYNAFQPGSEMDARLQTVPDPDRRMVTKTGLLGSLGTRSKIADLSPEEIGYMHAVSLKQDGDDVQFSEEGTILEVTLNNALKPGEKTVLEMEFKGQVPVHIRRAGRNNRNGVALSMAQWYPKMAEYDFQGWHTDPYIAREFHGVWGDFDVTIHIDKSYTIGGSGYLQNPQEIGHGYEDKSKPLIKSKNKKLSWHFVAPKVHDFTWAADPNYAHDILKTDSGVELHFFYKNSRVYKKAWKEVQPITAMTLDFFNEHIGPYPYKQYSVIQGGDGGMEYAMCTLIAGGSTLNSIAGTMIHEFAHSWFQFVLANNESRHSWMDEGFTEYISDLAYDKIMRGGSGKPSGKDYNRYFYAVKNGLDEPLTTHADRFETNRAFGIGSYTKGMIFMNQLNYIIGEENVRKTIKKYYEDFKFKHPTPNDITRTAEKVSGLHLGWYLNEFIETNHTIDYAVKDISGKNITLARVGRIPMPLDVLVTYTDGSEELFNIPLRMMRGAKPTTATVLDDWAWAYPSYSFEVSKEVKAVYIDPEGYMADVDRKNNVAYKN